MFYLNSLITRVITPNTYALNFNGTSQYLASQTTAQGGLDFVQWEWTQPWTYMFSGAATAGSAISFFNSRIGTSLGIRIFKTSALFLDFRGSGGRLLVNLNTAPINDFIIQITYDGSGLLSGVTVLINNIATTPAVLISSLTGTIAGSNSFYIGNDSTYYHNNTIKHTSFVDYVKSPSELSTDFNNKKQSIGTGSWLLAPIEPIYTDNGSTQIKSLITTDINNPLPNPVAFTNEQGYKLNLVNYPTPLVTGIDLIQL